MFCMLTCNWLRVFTRKLWECCSPSQLSWNSYLSQIKVLNGLICLFSQRIFKKHFLNFWVLLIFQVSGYQLFVYLYELQTHWNCPSCRTMIIGSLSVVFVSPLQNLTITFWSSLTEQNWCHGPLPRRNPSIPVDFPVETRKTFPFTLLQMCCLWNSIKVVLLNNLLSLY